MVANSSRMMMHESMNLLNPTGMFTTSSTQKPNKAYNPKASCDFFHMKGHLKIDCLKLLKCDFFHKTEHLKANCYKLIGYPPRYKGKRDTMMTGNSTYDAGNSTYDASSSTLTQQHYPS
ncbi:hypothetical protein KY284_007830 [Solanum tuberosum]|nr:hypothetical protein KY284_007830 [Solanum tuberosum]